MKRKTNLKVLFLLLVPFFPTAAFAGSENAILGFQISDCYTYDKVAANAAPGWAARSRDSQLQLEYIFGFISGVNEYSNKKTLRAFTESDVIEWFDEHCATYRAETMLMALEAHIEANGPEDLIVRSGGNCESYIKAGDVRLHEIGRPRFNYMTGFLSGVTSYYTTDILRNAGTAQIIEWFDVYCGQHPNTPIIEALRDYVTDSVGR